jgi:hypothetical protein
VETKNKGNYGRGEVVNVVIKIITELKGGEGGWEVVYVFVESGVQAKMDNRRGEVVDLCGSNSISK